MIRRPAAFRKAKPFRADRACRAATGAQSNGITLGMGILRPQTRP